MGDAIPILHGYVLIKEAARLLGVSPARTYQYVKSGDLPAQRIGPLLVVPVEEVRQFKAARARTPQWRSGTLLMTDMHVQVRTGKQALLSEKLRAIQDAETHPFPGTVAWYITKGNPEFTSVHILLIWKDTETTQQDLQALQDELADVLVWETAQSSTNEAIIHT